MFEACTTYEAGLAEAVDFPQNDKPVWILGKKYSAKYDLDELRAAVKSKIWLTYRRNFPSIGGNGPTSDSGWGCMLRCGQMVLAEALVRRHLGREWLWQSQCKDSKYAQILKLFEDKKHAIYSIHQIAQMGESEGKTVGQWFGPNTVAQVLKKLSVYDDWSSIAIYVAMDNTILINEIKSECKNYAVLPRRDDFEQSKKVQTKSDFNNLSHWQQPSLASHSTPVHKVNGQLKQEASNSSKNSNWKPLLLFVPLRLGLSEINPIYIQGLKKCFMLKQSLGLIGGRPNHACYFIGFMGNDLVYLDPHTVQNTVCLGCADPMCNKTADESFHCPSASRMDFLMLDPSVAVCFYCATEEEFDQMCDEIQRTIVEQENTPLFEICQERPWFEAGCSGYTLTDLNSSDFQVVETERTFDTSDDDYELL